MAKKTETVQIDIAIDNTDEVLALLEQRANAILKKCGTVAQANAVANITEKGAVWSGQGGGNLRNSITFEVEGNTMTVGTNVEYAPYIECGTGIYAEHSGAKKIPWIYYNEYTGKFYTTSGMKARPFLKPALEERQDVYKEIIENGLKNG